MPPQLATLLSFALIVFLFRRDFRYNRSVSRAVWIPVVWFLIICTRAVSTWLTMFGLPAGGGSLEDGSPIDAIVWFGLIAAALFVLSRRGVTIGDSIRNNPALSIYFAYCFFAIVWSDFPFVALKRWSKDLGNPIMILLLYSEPNFVSAVSSVFKRASYIIAPISILFIKYYPQWGRGFDEWTGAAFNTGITENKNALGWDCLILGFFFVWHLIMTLRSEKTKNRRYELLLSGMLLGMIAWLLSIADSKTPLICLCVGVAMLLVTGMKFNKRYIGIYILAAVLAVVAVDAVFGVYENALNFIGRDATLTTRTFLWAELKKWPINPVIGTGYDSFWLGERRLQLWKRLGWQASEAHNGYFETYLDLGAVGLMLMFGVLFSTYRSARRALVSDSHGFARFQFSFFFPVLLYNWTESSLGGLHPVWFTFLLLAIRSPINERRDLHHTRAGFVLEPRDLVNVSLRQVGVSPHS